MPHVLSADDLVALIKRVFVPGPMDTALAIIVDLPDAAVPDNDAWRARRKMASDWAAALQSKKAELGIETDLYVYRNTRAQNADLPRGAWLHAGHPLPESADALDPSAEVPFDVIFGTHRLFMAPTQFSATAPLKLNAKKYLFRAATMPGFSDGMIPWLKLDYGEIGRRVNLLKQLVDDAVLAEVFFDVDESDDYRLNIDLRHRKSHASGGLFPTPGEAGNLPSGETYIVPYEGELPDDPSRTSGDLPVQYGDEVVVYRVEANKAVGVEGSGPAAARERELTSREPAYANIAELGFGVLADFGVKPLGDLLSGEKLGPHIALGRSDHFGGMVGAAQFSRPEAVIHIDHVYIPEMQPRIRIRSLSFRMPDHNIVPIMRDGQYVIYFRKV
ncbi:MAG: hypothetical protein HY897_02060 [Deltaproteobacteria bacterium]|nr:hypothetical protein [Deltaproteobacteria bacterium]